MMKITPKQVERVHRLVRELCANCDEDGNCTLLDDGEAHRCVQLISIISATWCLKKSCLKQSAIWQTLFAVTRAFFCI